MVHLAAAAVIAADSSVRAAVGNVKLATAVTAAKEPREKGFTTANRATTHETLPVSILTDEALIPLELIPRNYPSWWSLIKTSQSLRSRRKPRTILLRPDSIVTRLSVRPKT
jgi:hypothetical protein